MMHRNHLIGMLIAMAGLLVVLLVFGVPLAQALIYAVALACPFMMVSMMFGGHGHGQHGVRQQQKHSEPADTEQNSTDAQQ